ncbi:helix-turn-helix transcriptional regulator [Mumia zhuanghuii]|uniref:Helix-turn-helix transcriptional regulator n=2 Tax=Mumia TaxID=1546255 RepID=A0ABW1QSR2_9ACTN|nr:MULTISPECIES: helix-turn-helix transcriptional regulator [Mumia]KAA1422956.1 helix-turn-helix transcriptional regulator [Mumia zhuanghuii]
MTTHLAPRPFRTSSNDPEVARQHLSEMYADVRFAAAPERGTFSRTTLALGGLSMSHLTLGMRFDAHLAPLEDVVVATRATGRYVVRPDGYGDLRAGGATMFMTPAGRPSHTTIDDVDLMTVSLDERQLQEFARSASDTPDLPLHFHELVPSSGDLERYVQAVLNHVVRNVMTSEAALESPLVRGETFNQVAAAVLAAFPNTTTVGGEEVPRSRWSGVSVVSRASDFIAAHAHEPLAVGDIADAVGVGARSLQQAFRRHVSTTPMEYVRRVRLDRARSDLLAADPGTSTVSQIALDWGFTNAGRFARHYQRAYGEAPSATLRR